MNYFKSLPNHPDYKPVKRFYKNASGVDEMIIMTQSHWDYVEWLENTTEIKFADWVIHCDKNPFEDHPISELLIYWLWVDECARFKEGLDTPTPFPPVGYKGWGDEEWRTAEKT